MSVNELESVSVTAPDGRALEVVLAGPAGGAALFFHHGTPGAAGVFAPLVEQGAERNLRHIAYSRPGYGRSDRLPGRSVASCAADVAAIADALGYERFHSIGGSGGGPHSLACAALLEDRIISAGVIASVAPFDAEGLDWTADMGQENIDGFAAIQGGEEELRTYLEGMAAQMGATPEQIVAALGDTVSEVDQRALTGAYGDYLAREVEQALANGVWGWVDDDIAFASDWGFDPASIRVPFSIWHGAHDRFVPIAHGQWLADHLTASTHLRPDQGHLSLALAAYGEVLDDLLKN